MNVRLLTWNLFHGRDHPPDPGLYTLRSRIFPITERGERYAQVNRPLLDEFRQVLAGIDWDVALLQEAPPRWHGKLGDGAAIALTSRNSFGALRALVGRVTPDLIASNEGGSNQTLVGPGWSIVDTRVHTIAARPERRRMLWTRLRTDDGAQLAVANLHASVRSVAGSEEEVIAAASRAVDWAGELPLVFGGDLNHSPAREPAVFSELEGRFGLAPPTPGDTIDHLLLRGLEVIDPPSKLPDSVRELRRDDGLLLQLSDHACVACTAGMK